MKTKQEIEWAIIDLDKELEGIESAKDETAYELESWEHKFDLARRRKIELEKEMETLQRKYYTTDEILGSGIYHEDYPCGGGPISGPCLIYCGRFIIDIYEDSYGLTIGNFTDESQCLRELEAILAEFMVDEGVVWVEQNS